MCVFTYMICISPTIITQPPQPPPLQKIRLDNNNPPHITKQKRLPRPDRHRGAGHAGVRLRVLHRRGVEGEQWVLRLERVLPLSVGGSALCMFFWGG